MKSRAVFQLRVTLRRIEPLIWRSVQVWEDIKLPQLHKVLQRLFLWEDHHQHEFRAGRRCYGLPDPEDASSGRNVLDERPVPLNCLASQVGGRFEYLYDWGDEWWHDLVLEAILAPAPGAHYPRCVDGARSGPPEDAGGPFGYAEFVEALQNPKHPMHEQMLEWRGPFDPEEFSLDKINSALRRAFPQRSRASTPGPKKPAS